MNAAPASSVKTGSIGYPRSSDIITAESTAVVRIWPAVGLLRISPGAFSALRAVYSMRHFQDQHHPGQIRSSAEYRP